MKHHLLLLSIFFPLFLQAQSNRFVSRTQDGNLTVLSTTDTLDFGTLYADSTGQIDSLRLGLRARMNSNNIYHLRHYTIDSIVNTSGKLTHTLSTGIINTGVYCVGNSSFDCGPYFELSFRASTAGNWVDSLRIHFTQEEYMMVPSTDMPDYLNPTSVSNPILRIVVKANVIPYSPPTALTENHSQTWQLSPNPSTGLLIWPNEQDLALLNLYDFQGRLIGQWINPQGNQMDLSNLPSGWYVVQAQTKNGHWQTGKWQRQ